MALSFQTLPASFQALPVIVLVCLSGQSLSISPTPCRALIATALATEPVR
jgi:hypothetical protein